MKKGILMAGTLSFLGAGLAGAKSAMGRCNNYMSAEELERAADKLSNFGGGAGVGYTGYGDPFLEFGGGDNGSFMDSINKGKVYNIQITNTTSGGGLADLTALICPGLISTATGLIQEGTFNDVSGTAGLKAKGAPYSISLFNAYMQRFPTYVLGFKISSTNLDQLEQTLLIQRESPFEIHQSYVINPSIYASEANPNTGLLTVNYQFQLDNETKISYKVLGGATVNFGIVFGASLKISKALTSKVSTAAATKASFMGR